MQKLKSLNLLREPIDQYGRYYIVASIINEIATLKKTKKFTILDVGGYKGLTERFFSKDNARVTVLDQYDNNTPGYVKGSALDLPFSDNSFDYVVSFEVLEHIPREHRERFVTEALRVAKGPFILTAPFAGKNAEVEESEALVNNFWSSIYKTNHKWLHEHIDNRIPREKELENILQKHKLPYRKIGNNNLLLWNLMLSFNFITTLYRPSGSNPAVQQFYNENIDILESNAEAYYRYIYIIGNDEARLRDSIKTMKVNKTDLLKKEAELISKVFTVLGKDMNSVIKHKDETIKQLSNTLTERIRTYDNIAEELEKKTAELEKIKNSPGWRIGHRLIRLKDNLIKRNNSHAA